METLSQMLADLLHLGDIKGRENHGRGECTLGLKRAEFQQMIFLLDS